MSDLPALGYCPQCKEPMISVNGAPSCITCAKPQRPKHIVKPPPVGAAVPSETDLARMSGISGKTVPKKTTVVVGQTAQDALQIMKHLPMPKDLKEFRQIQKIIKQLEKLVGDNHDD